MRRLPPALGALLFALATHAQEAAAPPTRSGYAFDSPRVLTQQRLFGLAHGIALLAGACRASPPHAPSSTVAYMAWQERQAPTIAAAVADLGRYYFGSAAVEPAALVRQLALKEALDPAPDAPELAAACATLPEALAQPRYDLAARWRQEEAMAQVVVAADIAARDRHCRERLSDLALQLHTARYDTWREINEPLLQQASARLEREWPVDAPAATFAAWRAELYRTTRAGGSTADCLAFSASLKQPDSALRNAFRLPPPQPGPTPP